MKLIIIGQGTLGTAIHNASWTKAHITRLVSRNMTEVGDRLDISSQEAVDTFFKDIEPGTVVINCAALTNVDECEMDPKQAQGINALGVKHLAIACARQRLALLHISTDYVFSGNASKPYTEEDSTGPCSIYGMTKLGGEYYALTIPQASVVVRSTWLFGAGKGDFVNSMIGKLKKNEAVRVVGDQTASPTYAKDLAKSLKPIVEDSFARAWELHQNWNKIYHITNRGEGTRYDMVMQLDSFLGTKNTIGKITSDQLTSWKAVRPKFSVLSSASYEADFGSRLRPWEEALKEYVGSL